MPNGSKQYQQTESDCLRNSDGDASVEISYASIAASTKKAIPSATFASRDFRPAGSVRSAGTV